MVSSKNRARNGKRWMKAEMHSHCSLDPDDYKICPQTPEQLIEEAARLDYDILAITCHNLDIWSPALADHARGLGILLIPGMEVSVHGSRHVLAYNFGLGAEDLDTLDKMRDRVREDTLLVAAHPYFPSRMCLGKLLDENIDLFHAIESSGFFAPGLDFNRRARKTAQQHQKPMVGNGDVHLLWQLGRTFTWVYAEPELNGVLSAIKQGMVRVETTPLSYWEIPRWWGTALMRKVFPLRQEPDPGGLLQPLGNASKITLGSPQQVR